MPESRSYAFFDLDHTLLPFDTQALFCNFVLHRRPWRVFLHLLFLPFALGRALRLVSTTTANITAKAVTVTGVTAANKVYDGNTTATPAFGTAALSGVVVTDTATLVTSGATATFADKAVGNGKTVTLAGLTLAGGDAGNYSLTQPTTTANITAKALTVANARALDKIYDGSTVATLSFATAQLTGALPGETVTLVTTGATGHHQGRAGIHTRPPCDSKRFS
jgi:hypothetical protein